MYRFEHSKVAPKKGSSPKGRATLFSTPAPLPEAKEVDKVKPTTEADDYKWIDYGATTFDSTKIKGKPVGGSTSSDPTLTPESPNDKFNPSGCWGPRGVSGKGPIVEVASTGKSITSGMMCCVITGYSYASSWITGCWFDSRTKEDETP